jgi:uncharacterized protein (TIRG00374 family)
LFRSIRFWGALAISAVLIALFLRAIHPRELAEAFSQVNYWYMAPAIAVLFVALTIRVVRWSILLRPVASIAPQRLFTYAIIGYMANNLLPARAGELVRAYVLGDRERISKVGTLGSIAVERLFDGTTLVLLFVGAGATVGFNDRRLDLIAIASAGLFAVALVGFYALTLSEARARRVVRWLVGLLPRRFEHRAEEMAENLLASLRSVHDARTLGVVVLLSVAGWTVEAAAYAIIGLGFGFGAEEVNFGHYVLLLAAANLAIIVPTFFGGTGPFEWAATLVLVGAGVASAQAGAYSILAHAVIFIPTTVLGLVFLWSFGVSFARVIRPEAATEERAPVP